MSLIDTLSTERQRLINWKIEQLAVHEQNMKVADDHLATRKAQLSAEIARLEQWHAERAATHQTNVKKVINDVRTQVALIDQQVAAEKQRLEDEKRGQGEQQKAAAKSA